MHNENKNIIKLIMQGYPHRVKTYPPLFHTEEEYYSKDSNGNFINDATGEVLSCNEMEIKLMQDQKFGRPKTGLAVELLK